MRLDIQEREALRYALQDFRGSVYLFGSRLNDSQRGGDIDILLIPDKKTNPLKLSLAIQRKCFLRCEGKIDISGI